MGKQVELVETHSKELTLIYDKVLKDVSLKIDSQDFDDEVRMLSAAISVLNFEGKANMMRG